MKKILFILLFLNSIFINSLLWASDHRKPLSYEVNDELTKTKFSLQLRPVTLKSLNSEDKQKLIRYLNDGIIQDEVFKQPYATVVKTKLLFDPECALQEYTATKKNQNHTWFVEEISEGLDPVFMGVLSFDKIVMSDQDNALTRKLTPLVKEESVYSIEGGLLPEFRRKRYTKLTICSILKEISLQQSFDHSFFLFKYKPDNTGVCHLIRKIRYQNVFSHFLDLGDLDEGLFSFFSPQDKYHLVKISKNGEIKHHIKNKTSTLKEKFHKTVKDFF